jgi:hypothetical protein
MLSYLVIFALLFGFPALALTLFLAFGAIFAVFLAVWSAK